MYTRPSEMPDTTTSKKAQAEIPHGIVEYTAVFKKPIFAAWSNLAAFIEIVLGALSPHGFTLDGIEAKTQSAKLSENVIVFRRPTPPDVSFSVSLQKLIIVAVNLDWTEADQFITTATAGFDAVKRAVTPEIESQHLALGMHVQIKTKPRKEVTAPLMNPAVLGLLDGEVQSNGIILQRDKSSIIIDASLAYANGLFVRLTREHSVDTSFARMAEILRADEERLFDFLGIEGAL